MFNIKEDERLNPLNHSCAHLLAQAMCNLYPGTKLWVGPVVNEGFYYDMDLGENNISEEDFPKIEKEMKKLAKDGKKIIGREISKEEALEKYKNNPYKTYLINKFGDDQKKITIFTQGEFADLCRGGHVESLKELKIFKLLKVAGAYWLNDSKNVMLTRIYGVCFDKQEDLDSYLSYLEECKARDHRKLGKDLNIFTTNDLVGPGLNLWLPNGSTIRRILERYIVDKEIESGYQHVYTPVLGTTNLFKISGHWDHYKDGMFPVMDMDHEQMVLRPMNCPYHAMIFKSSLHSYRDLPIKIGELGQVFRYEKSGALCGLERVRGMCQNDAHIFVRPDQIKQEFEKVVSLILDVYKELNINDYEMRLSLRGEDNEKYYKDDEMWDNAENALRNILNEMGVKFVEAKNEAAFYGPKLDIQIKTALGHDLTLSTCQLDFLLPRKFELSYIDENGLKKTPVLMHRAIFGSFERFIAYLLEEYKGCMPLWLAPIQIMVIPVHHEYHLEYAKEVFEKLKKNNFRVELNDKNEKLGYRIREANTNKIPVQIVIGEEEVNQKTVMVRRFGSKEQNKYSLDEFLEIVKAENDQRKNYSLKK